MVNLRILPTPPTRRAFIDLVSEIDTLEQIEHVVTQHNSTSKLLYNAARGAIRRSTGIKRKTSSTLFLVIEATKKGNRALV